MKDQFYILNNLTNLKMRFMHLAQCKNATEFLKVLFNEINYNKEG